MGILLSLPLILLLVLFALSNKTQVELRLWPLDYVWVTPLSIAVLIGMAGAFIVGALLVWGAALAARRRARRAERMVRLLEEQVRALRAEPPPPALAAPR